MADLKSKQIKFPLTGTSVVSSSAQIATDISGSFVADSGSFSTRITTDSGSFSTRVTTAETELTNTLVSSSAQIATDISGSFVADSGSFSTRVTTAETELSNTLVSSSAQIATDISGSFVADSGSFSTRVTTTETELSNTLVSSSAQIATDISGSFVADSGSFSTRVTTAETELGNTLISGSAQIATDISGSFTAPSASISTRLTTTENVVSSSVISGSAQIDHDSTTNFVANEHIDHTSVSIVAGTGLTGGGTIAANRTLNVIGGTGVTANANDIAIGQAVETTSNVKFNHITGSGNISGSLGDILGYKSGSFNYLETSANISSSGGITVDTITTTATASLASIKLSGESGHISGSLGVITGFTQANITSGSFNYVNASGNVTASKLYGTVGTATQATIDHDSLANFVSDEHVAHGDVSIVAGTGLTGGGTIAANRTLNVIGGTGVTANANDIAIGQDVATTANVLFNHISASGNISSSGTGSFERLEVGGGGGISLETVTASDTGSFASIELSGESGHLSGSLGLITGFKNIEGTSGSFSYLETTANISSSASGSFLNVNAPHITATNVHGTILTATQATIDHDSLANFVANEHIDHTSVTMTAGAGLTGGGTIAATRTLAVGAGTGVTVNANDVAIGQAVATDSDVEFATITTTGNITVQGDIIAENYIVSSSVTHLTSSAISGSSIFGDTQDDTHQFTGSVFVSGSTFNIDAIGSVSSSNSGSFLNVKATNNVNATNLYGTVLTATQATIDHDSLANFVANEHIDHSAVSVVAGAGLTGGGTIAANRTINVVGGDGITANANDIAITAAQTTITSVLAEDLKLGEDAQTKIDFETSNEIHFDVNNIETFNMAGLQLSGSQASTGSFGSVVTDANVGVGVVNPSVALEVIGSISGSQSGSFLNVDITDNLGVTGKFTLPNITDVSASIAAAVAGGDNMGNHTAEQDLDMDGNDIFDIQHISSSGNISGSAGDILGFDSLSIVSSGSFGTNLGIGTTTPAESLEVIGAISASTSGSFLNLDVDKNINTTNLYGTILTATQATIDHDSLANFVADEHVVHGNVSVIAGTGLTGGGTIAANRTLNVIGGTGVTANANDIAIGQDVATTANVTFNHISASGNISGSAGSLFGFNSGSFNTNLGIGTLTPAESLEVIGAVSASTSGSFLNIEAPDIKATRVHGTILTATQATIDHDSLANFVADEHVVHGDVSVIAGTGLTGGGTIAANRTLNVIGGDGITANANDIAITAAQTTITSVLAEDLKLGEDAQTKIDFETSNEIHFDVNNIETFNMAGLQLSGSQVSTGSFGSVVTDANVGIGESNPSVPLEVIGDVSSSASGSFLNVNVTSNLEANVASIASKLYVDDIEGITNNTNRLSLDDDTQAGIANGVSLTGINHIYICADESNNGTGAIRFRKGTDNDLDSGTAVQLAEISNAGDLTIEQGSLFISGSEKVYFGAGSHTYISEDINDRLRFFTGGAEFMRFTEDSSDTINLYKDTTFASSASMASLEITGEAGHISGSQSTLKGFKQANITSGSFDYMNVTGNVTASSLETSGDVIAFGSSDRELKDNIQPIENPLEKMEKIGGYTFVWNDKQSTYKGEDIGVVAQEIQSVLPEIVATRANGYLGVKYEKIVPLLIESIKENTKQIKELKQEINEIKENCDCLNK